MNIYETVIICKPDIDGTTKSKYIDLFTHITGKKRGIKYEDMGIKKLAYKIKDTYDEGYYLIFTWKGTPENVTEVERQIRIDDDVIKFMTVRFDEESLMEKDYNDDEFDEVDEEFVDGSVESEQGSQDAWDMIFI